MSTTVSAITRNVLISCLFALFFCSSVVAAPAPVISLDYRGSGVFTISGINLVDVGGFKIQVNYDQTVLEAPSVDKGALLGSLMMIPNTGTAGQVIITSMTLGTQGVNGTGVLATITFKEKGTLNAASTRMSVPQFASTKGEPLSTPLISVNNQKVESPTGDGTTTSGSTTSGSTTSGSTTSGSTTSGSTTSGSNATGGTQVVASTGATISVGTVALPTDQFAAAEKKEDSQTIYTDLRKDLAGKPKEGEEKPKEEPADDKGAEKFVAYAGALPQFKKVSGEKTPTALMLFFADQTIAGFKQEPPILLTDGTAKVKLSVGGKLLGKETPSFAVSSAKILSLAPEEDGSWTLVVQPKKGAVDSILSISSGTGGADIPLLVAPIVDPNISKSGKLSEADFVLFLKETGAPKAPKFDLNGDGKRDYLDDYIFTANYLVKMKIKPESLKPKETDQKTKAKEVGKKPEKTEGKGQPESPAAKGTKPAETRPAESKPTESKPALPEKKAVPKEQ